MTSKPRKLAAKSSVKTRREPVGGAASRPVEEVAISTRDELRGWLFRRHGNVQSAWIIYVTAEISDEAIGKKRCASVGLPVGLGRSPSAARSC